MSLFYKSVKKKSNLQHLIIGGGYVAEFHIRASLFNQFNIFVIEPDNLKREYLNEIFPEIKLFEKIEDFIKQEDIKNINLISILIPTKIREKVYETLPNINCTTLIEKPLSDACIKKFNHEKTFLCLNHSYNSSGKILHKNLKKYLEVSSLDTFRPSPGKLLRQNSIEEYLIDYLPHTLTPLNILFVEDNPYIQYKYSEKESHISGKYITNKKTIDFKISISNKTSDTILKIDKRSLSYEYSLIDINKKYTNIKKFLKKMVSIFKNNFGYGTMHHLYKDLNDLIEKNISSTLLNKLKISKTKYIIF